MKKYCILIISLFCLGACVNHKNLYTLEKDYLERRNIETRIFNTTENKKILISSAQVLQDMGYSISESEAKIGVLTASKLRESGSTAGKAALVVLAAFAGTQAVYEDSQRFYVSIVNTKINEKQTRVRVIFARTSYDNYGNVLTIQKLEDEQLYQEFFDKLSQSIFLTNNDI